MFPLLGAVAASAECFFPCHILPVSSNQPLRDFASPFVHVELEAVIASLISKNENYFQRAEKGRKMIIKDSWSCKWINEQKTNSVLFHNNTLSAIWCSPSSHRNRTGLQNAEWFGVLLCPARPQICTHSGHRKWPGSYYTVVLSILWQAFPKALWYLDWQLSFYCWAKSETFGYQGQGDVPRNRLMGSCVFQTGHYKSSPPGMICTMASSWRAAMWLCLA